MNKMSEKYVFDTLMNDKFLYSGGGLFDNEKRIYYFADSVAKEVFQYHIESKQLERRTVSEGVCYLIPTENDDHFLAVGVNTLYRYVWSTGAMVALHNNGFGPKYPYMGAAIDSRGRLWLGTKDGNFLHGAGLYVLQSNGELVKKAENKSEVTSIAFSPDDTKLYVADSRNTIVHVYDFDVNTGDVSNERVFVSFAKRPEYQCPEDFDISCVSGVPYDKIAAIIENIEMPTGLLTAKDGSIWVLGYHVARIVKLNPETANIEDEIKLPSSVNTPLYVILGDNDSELYVQTLCAYLDEGMRQKFFESGKTLRIRKADGSKFDAIRATAKFALNSVQFK